MTEQQKWDAVCACDAGQDGRFFYAVETTGVFCRPSCKSRQPERRNVRYFDSGQQALQAGFRPCKRCRPDLLSYDPLRDLAERARDAVERGFQERAALQRALGEMGLSPRRLAEVFRSRYGVTPGEYAGALRLERARHMLLQTDEPIAQVAFAVGFESVGSFYRFFKARAGVSPARYRNGER